MQPGAEVRARLESGQLPVGLQESLLDDILGILRAPGHPEGEPEHSTAVAIHECTVSLAICVAGQRDGGSVRLLHPID